MSSEISWGGGQGCQCVAPNTENATRFRRLCRKGIPANPAPPRSFSSAADTAEQYPQYSEEIIEAAKQSFIKGEDFAYLGGVVAILLGMALVWKYFPKYDREAELLAIYASEDADPGDS